jgi:ergothioneine biosynthesis protein EgtB
MSAIENVPMSPQSLDSEYVKCRTWTEFLIAPLQPDDFMLQATPDASPAKWHLAHTSWFFETFVLAPNLRAYVPIREDANYLFNSYYNAIGDRIARDRRGLMSRPTIEEVLRYRSEVDRRMSEFLAGLDAEGIDQVASTVVLGLNHEQQHQELLLTDLKVAFGWNPTHPVYGGVEDCVRVEATPLRWIAGGGQLQRIGFEGLGFAFDNETPRHRVFLEPFSIASRPATNAEYLAFVEDGGYGRPELWLSDGWATRNAAGWSSPMYWEKREAEWHVYTLGGMRPLVMAEPVTHLSFYEADAFARWSDARLATEAEWETVANGVDVEGNFAESGRFHPAPSAPSAGPAAMFGDVWEWTGSPYVAYPGYRPAAGALGEYNGKFMCNQMVLRGGSCATPTGHIRPTYRNFFPPSARWQFSGVRLARDAV